MSKIEVDQITQQSGTTITVGGGACKTAVVDATTVTLGRCGGSVALASGASQTGFGATGGISWQTAIKTADFTAVSGEGYFVNTSGGSDITVTLPASPSAGNVVAIKDYARTFGTNKVILDRNGSNMDGSAVNTNLTQDGSSIICVFMDSTKGWSFINEDTTTTMGASFVAATGGTISTTPCGNFKIHKFTSPGTFCVSSAGGASGSNTVEILAVGAGGGGGGDNGGGGGAGAVGHNPAVPVSVQGYPIVIGAGGAGGDAYPDPSGDGATGTAVTFFGNTMRAGSGGKGSCSPGTIPGTYSNGGGGAGVADTGPGAQVGNGVTGVSHPAISGYTISGGNTGGTGRNTSSPGNPGPGNLAGGGAGAGANGTSPCTPSLAGAGGAGVPNNICGGGYSWGGGGGGGTNCGTAGAGGIGGGGGGGSPPSSSPSVGAGGAGLNNGASGVVPTRAGGAGGANTGGGGGGSGRVSTANGGNGGSGILIIKYRFQ